MKGILLLCTLLLCTVLVSAQDSVVVKDNAKVGFINIGSGANINVTQIFEKSPEYAEIQKRLNDLDVQITAKAEKCDKYKEQIAKDDCRAELIVLNQERDSVQKIEKRFREDIIRLAETFSSLKINSERLRLAKQFFNEGKVRDAKNVLNAKEMQEEGNALLIKKTKEQQALHATDSLLRVKADEFALKAYLEATEYDDPLRYDSAQIYFEQSLLYAETVENLWSFAHLLWEDKQSQKAIPYFEHALRLETNEQDEAGLVMMLGNVYFDIQKIEDAEKMYLRSREIYERLAKSKPAQFESKLAAIYVNLGSFYYTNQKMGDAEKMYLRSLEISERLAKSNPAQFEPKIALTTMNFGNFYYTNQKMGDSEKMYLRSLEVYERLAKSNPAQFDSDLAALAVNLGNFYFDVQKMGDAEKMYLRSLEIFERLAKSNPTQFDSDLAFVLSSLGIFHESRQQFEKARAYFSLSLSLLQKMVLSGQTHHLSELIESCTYLADVRDSLVLRCDWVTVVSIQKERADCIYTVRNLSQALAKSVAQSFDSLAMYFLFARQYPEAQSAAEESLALDPTQNQAYTHLGHSYLLRGNWKKAKTIYKTYLKNEPSPITAKKSLLKDLDNLEIAGVTHPEMVKARAWLRE